MKKIDGFSAINTTELEKISGGFSWGSLTGWGFLAAAFAHSDQLLMDLKKGITQNKRLKSERRKRHEKKFMDWI